MDVKKVNLRNNGKSKKKTFVASSRLNSGSASCRVGGHESWLLQPSTTWRARWTASPDPRRDPDPGWRRWPGCTTEK